ncbi:MAG TPA: cupin domain-containing protein [Anaerolineae bacterium]|nr:cupin domain-containing protein [Anaerolineae bacterium]
MAIGDRPQAFHWGDLLTETVLPGIDRQRIDGERMTIVRYVYAPGSVFPAHSHPEEQITVVLSGEIEFDVDGQLEQATAGSVIVIPPNAVHGARILGDQQVETLNVLSPRRTRDVFYAASHTCL